MLSRLTLATTLLFGTTVMAAPISYYAVLSGPAEAPPNASPGTGLAWVTIDTAANTMRIQASFSGLTGLVTVTHIHCCTAVPGTATAGVATVTPTFTGFPSGVTGGTYDFTYNTEAASGTWNPAYVTANGGTAATAEAAFAAGVAEGRAYFNIHSSLFPGGEIRGFLAPVPEPSTWALSLGALAGLATLRMRRK